MTVPSQRETTSVLAMPAEDRPVPLAESSTKEPSPRSRPRVNGRRLFRWGRWIALLGLIGLNAWWWRDSRPLPDLKSMEMLINQQRDADAEQALRRRLDYSPHDGDAHAMLAKIFGQRGDMLACARELGQIPFWWPSKGKFLLME